MQEKTQKNKIYEILQKLKEKFQKLKFKDLIDQIPNSLAIT